MDVESLRRETNESDGRDLSVLHSKRLRESLPVEEKREVVGGGGQETGLLD